MYTALNIAKFFINFANKQIIDNGGVYEGVTNLKLQKLLYFAQAIHLATNNTALFQDEVCAWKYGPVVPNVYHFYKKFENKPIDNEVLDNSLPEEVLELLEQVWDLYGKYSATELVEITHTHKPWKEIYYGSDEESAENKIIPVEKLKSYYQGYYVIEKSA